MISAILSSGQRTACLLKASPKGEGFQPSPSETLTDLADEFLLPSNPTHRQYEALRTFFVDRAPSAEAAERFGYTTREFSRPVP